ncbi:carbohydrate-binding module family 18 protein [Xylariaceae sp. FL0016]|nr:carbohydrate-binding module family 18 protein [Xylariaceae sp. FL0016]
MACCILLWLMASTLYSPATATFSSASKNNVVVYYGQGPSQQPLSTYCADPSIDIIVLSFVHLFPAQANGYPGINFGNQCSGDKFTGPGYGGKNVPANNQLLKCPSLQKDLYTCRQTSTKKILLSLGGGTAAYELTGATDGDALATMLWYMFGPRDADWVARGLPRPLDYTTPGSGATMVGFSVDGFDLDIEHAAATAGSEGYRTLVTKLRSLYARAPGTFYLSGSPQCVVPDANMGELLKATTFDMVFVQFYNTPQCSARRWAEANPGYAPGDKAFDVAGFTFDAWTAFLSSTYSRNARLYIGMPGSARAANAGFDVSVAQAGRLASAFYCRSNFGGVAVWEATYASENVVGGKNFYQGVKAALGALSSDSRMSCSTPVPTTPQSTDGSCGSGSGSCASGFCCSKYGYCGTTADYCGSGCQKGFGKCS